MKLLRNKWLVSLVALLLAAMGLAVWAFVIEPARLTVDSQTLSVKGWPLALNGLRVVLASDLHIGAPHIGADKLPKLVALINEQQPDLILLAGDFVVGDEIGASQVAPETIAAGLRGLRARLGVWAVLGNHDWWTDGPGMRKALENNGIKVLENSATRFTDKGEAFWLIGLGDHFTNHTDLKGALTQVTDDAPALALTHSPDVFPSLPDRILLTFAGHTHGGQVWLPFLGRPVIPSAYGQRYATGHIQEGARHLFVTNGVGTSILPVRFLVPPEITVLTLASE